MTEVKSGQRKISLTATFDAENAYSDTEFAIIAAQLTMILISISLTLVL